MPSCIGRPARRPQGHDRALVLNFAVLHRRYFAGDNLVPKEGGGSCGCTSLQRPVPLRRSRRTRPRLQTGDPGFSSRLHGREGSPLLRNPGFADGGGIPGPGACLVGSCHLRRPTVAWPRSLRHWRLSLPGRVGGRARTGGGRSSMGLAPHRANPRRSLAGVVLLRERRSPPISFLPRRRRKPSRPGLPRCGGPVHGGGSRRHAYPRATLHSGPRPVCPTGAEVQKPAT